MNFSIVAPLNISPGFHFLGIRIKDAEGKWSLYDQRSFYLGTVTSDLPHVMAAEYFYDNDPGLGNATPPATRRRSLRCPRARASDLE